MSALGSCPDCGTELVAHRSRRQSARSASWCWKCERVLRAGEARRARLKAERDTAAVELCEKCGEPIYARHHPALRMCARHAVEHLRSLPPFACTSADMAARVVDERCDTCGHLWSKHEFDGCTQLTARVVTSYGKVVEDTGPFVCRCREVDPACSSPEPAPRPVTRLA